MKILQFILPLGLGGVERIVAMLYKYGNAHGEEVYIAIGKKYKLMFCNKYEIKDSSRIFEVDDENLLASFLSLKKIINNVRPNIIHTHARRECFLGCLAKQLNMKHIRTQHMSEKPNVKVTFLEKLLLRFCVNIWVATSKQLATTYLKNLRYINQKKIKIVYNGIDKEVLKSSHSERCYKFCIVSRLTRQKGIDILIDRIKGLHKELLTKINIDIWGEGEEKEPILNEIRKFHLESIIKYKGPTDHPTKILQNYDALLMPSRYEGLPLTMLEAMSVKTPVAIHDVGCVREFLTPDKNGWIITDKYTWQDFFQDVTNPNYNIIQISEGAFKTYLDKFKGDTMCNKYINLYRDNFIV